MTPDVNLSQDKFGIRLEVPGPDGMAEMWIRCDSVTQFLPLKWNLNSFTLKFYNRNRNMQSGWRRVV